MIKELLQPLCQRPASWNSGASAVEFAIAAPLVIVLLLGAVDYGILTNTLAALFGGTRSGAEVAHANPSVTAAQLTALNVFPTNASGSVSSVCSCTDNTTVACPGAGAANPCSANADPRVIKYIDVSATQNFTPLFAIANLLLDPAGDKISFGFPANPLSAATYVRIQ
jgi:Flp pilus assembly protein TadG